VLKFGARRGIFLPPRADQARLRANGARLSSGGAMVILEHPAQTLSALDRTCFSADFVAGFDELVFQALMFPCSVIVSLVFGNLAMMQAANLRDAFSWSDFLNIGETSNGPKRHRQFEFV
jgi:hypothetical protein